LAQAALLELQTLVLAPVAQVELLVFHPEHKLSQQFLRLEELEDRLQTLVVLVALAELVPEVILTFLEGVEAEGQVL
jgi:hypothetical protein